MNGRTIPRYYRLFPAGLGALVAAAGLIAALARGPSWGISAFAGAAVVAADVYFLVRFGEFWLSTSRRGKRAALKGIGALIAKTAAFPGLIIGLAAAGLASPVALAAGALAAAVAAPPWLMFCLLGPRAAEARTVDLWKD